MCNLYSHTKGQAAILEATRAMIDRTGNLPPQPGIFPDYSAPIVRNAPQGRQLVMARWGMPSPSQVLFEATKKRAGKLEAKAKPVDFKALLRMEPDGGVTNIRNTGSSHWRPWLGPENRCVVPFTSFSEFNRDAGGDIWFAFDNTRPLAFFAGIWTCLDVGAEGQRRRGHGRPVRFPDHDAERRSRRRSPEGDAGYPDHERGGRPLDERALERGGGATTAAAERST